MDASPASARTSAVPLASDTTYTFAGQDVLWSWPDAIVLLYSNCGRVTLQCPARVFVIVTFISARIQHHSGNKRERETPPRRIRPGNSESGVLICSRSWITSKIRWGLPFPKIHLYDKTFAKIRLVLPEMSAKLRKQRFNEQCWWIRKNLLAHIRQMTSKI